MRNHFYSTMMCSRQKMELLNRSAMLLMAKLVVGIQVGGPTTHQPSNIVLHIVTMYRLKSKNSKKKKKKEKKYDWEVSIPGTFYLSVKILQEKRPLVFLKYFSKNSLKMTKKVFGHARLACLCGLHPFGQITR